MITKEKEILYKDISYKIIGLAMEVHSKLGHGFLEKVYENAMMIEFGKEKILAIAQSPIKVIYENETVGEYYADILVDNKVIVEIKAAKNDE